MPKAKHTKKIIAQHAGYLTAIEARTVGFAAVALGAGRAKAEDAVDFGAGFVLAKKPGDRVKPGDAIATAYASSAQKLSDGARMFEASLAYGPKAPRKEPLIREIIK
jgi:thymidine phosphorylase